MRLSHRPLLSAARALSSDLKALLSAPFRAPWNARLKAALFLAALAVCLANDARMMERVHFDRANPADKPLTLLERLGENKAVLAVSALAMAGGKAAGLPPLSEVGVLALETQVFTNLFNSAFKGAFGRRRPSEAEGAGEFRPFTIERGGRNGFPSAHAAHAFGFATAVAMRGGAWWGVPAYALAGTVGAARVLHRDHYPSDVLAGAALGIYVGRILGRRHRKGRDDQLPAGT